MKVKIKFLIVFCVAMTVGLISLILSPLMVILIISYEQGVVIRNWIENTLEDYL
jgi:hypothetical protein